MATISDNFPPNWGPWEIFADNFTMLRKEFVMVARKNLWHMFWNPSVPSRTSPPSNQSILIIASKLYDTFPLRIIKRILKATKINRNSLLVRTRKNPGARNSIFRRLLFGGALLIIIKVNSARRLLHYTIQI